MKSLSQIYQQIKEQVLPNTQTKGNANQTSARGGTMSVATGSVPSVPKEKQAAHISGNFRAGQDAIKRKPSTTPTSSTIPSAGKRVITRDNSTQGTVPKGGLTGLKQPVKAGDTGVRKPIGGTNSVPKVQPKPQASPGSLGKAQRIRAGAKAQDATMKKVTGVTPANQDAIDKAKQGRTAQPTQATAQVSRIKTAAPAKGTAQASTGTTKTATTPAKPAEKEQTFGQAFAAARKKAGGAGGVFTYKGKKYQTNVKGEKYLKTSKLKNVDEATDHKALYKKIRTIIAEGKEHTDHDQLGAKNAPKQSIFKNTLGALEKRKWSGNQKRTDGSYTVDKSLVAEKNTDTGEPEDEITLNPREKSKSNNSINTSDSQVATKQ